MDISIPKETVKECGINSEEINQLVDKILLISEKTSEPSATWQACLPLITRYPFPIQLAIFTSFYPAWYTHPETAPAWLPSDDEKQNANISTWLKEKNMSEVSEFHRWSYTNPNDFWGSIIKKLEIKFQKNPDSTLDVNGDVTSPNWLPNAKLNIAESCFNASQHFPAICYQDANKNICHMSYEELNKLSNQIANGLVGHGFKPGDAIGIAMPMNKEAVAIYIGIIKMGGVVVSIADSFSTQEMKVRLDIAKATAIFTQDVILRAGKKIPLYEKVKATGTKTIIVLSAEKIAIKHNHTNWNDFISANNKFAAIACDPMTTCNILFSSGTTGAPKAICWNHTTPIKCASDAYFHQNIKEGDVLAWPTNLGWMMGPWLIFAALINKATIALFEDVPRGKSFGHFIQEAGVTMLGVVPTLVASWRQDGYMEQYDWSKIKIFTSTGECSNAEDMLYLMSLADYKPIIEYCGGTEIGGAYLTNTVIQANIPSLFSTPTMGTNIAILDEQGKVADHGEVAIIPPAMGLSTTLLNTDHHEVYFKGMPKIDGKKVRRHGDQIIKYKNNYYSILGRADDTMNLSGIKISAAEIERTIAGCEGIKESAAIAVADGITGPKKLVIYSAADIDIDKIKIMKQMQNKINKLLNPLFKINNLIIIDDLPKTASNKVMRRVLRDRYKQQR